MILFLIELRQTKKCKASVRRGMLTLNQTQQLVGLGASMEYNDFKQVCSCTFAKTINPLDGTRYI